MRTKSPTFFDQMLSLAAWFNLAAVLVVAVLIMVVGERWWFSAALAYLPRLPWLLPSVVILFLLLLKRPKLAPLALVPALIVAVPLMSLCMPVATAKAGDQSIRVATCNIQSGFPRFGSVVRELQRLEPDVILFQECETPRDEIAAKWPGFYHDHVDEYDVTSRWPVERLDILDNAESHRFTAAIYRIAHPERPFVLVNVHLSTAREGLAHLRNNELSLSESTQRLANWQIIREAEVHGLAERVSELMDEPVVLAGDFNQPWSSQFIQADFPTATWTNAFDVAGTGYGYTAPTDTERLWPHNTPWLRIDHIVVNDRFGVLDAEVGASAGSDHRLVAADLTW